jgi:hypothetical protein
VSGSRAYDDNQMQLIAQVIESLESGPTKDEIERTISPEIFEQWEVGFDGCKKETGS